MRYIVKVKSDTKFVYLEANPKAKAEKRIPVTIAYATEFKTQKAALKAAIAQGYTEEQVEILPTWW
jgi:hypothetical protein